MKRLGVVLLVLLTVAGMVSAQVGGSGPGMSPTAMTLSKLTVTGTAQANQFQSTVPINDPGTPHYAMGAGSLSLAPGMFIGTNQGVGFSQVSGGTATRGTLLNCDNNNSHLRPNCTMGGNPAAATAGSLTAGSHGGQNVKTLTESAATTIANIEGPLVGGGLVNYCILAMDAASEAQYRCAEIRYSIAIKSGAATCVINPAGATELTDGNAGALTSGTLTYTWSFVANGATCDLKVNAVSSLTQTALVAYYGFLTPLSRVSFTPQ